MKGFEHKGQLISFSLRLELFRIVTFTIWPFLKFWSRFIQYSCKIQFWDHCHKISCQIFPSPRAISKFESVILVSSGIQIVHFMVNDNNRNSCLKSLRYRLSQLSGFKEQHFGWNEIYLLTNFRKLNEWTSLVSRVTCVNTPISGRKLSGSIKKTPR